MFLGLTLQIQAKYVSIVAKKPDLQQAEILQNYLQLIYIKDTFTIKTRIPETSDAIVLKADGNIGKEEFKIASKKINGQSILTVRYGGRSGMYYAVFKLLEELGCGFFLSFEELPQFQKEIQSIFHG